MDIELARTFLEVVSTGSFMRAAERLNVGQTTVSVRIKLLEQQLGWPTRQRAGSRSSSIHRPLSGNDISGRIKPSADKAGVVCDIERVLAIFPAEGIAEATKCDLIVMASPGRCRLAKLLLGSKTLRVLNELDPRAVCR